MELLLDQTFAFTLADVRKNILVPFRVDRDFDHLAICLHYGPKAIRDPEIIMPQIRKCVKTYFPAGYQLTEADMQEYQELFNFVTLSLDKNGEYVGCAYRHPLPFQFPQAFPVGLPLPGEIRQGLPEAFRLLVPARLPCVVPEQGVGGG